MSILDCRGRPCPVPVIELAKTIETVSIGEVLTVLADDAAAEFDIPAWCRLRGQEYLGRVDVDDASGYQVRRVS